MQYKKVFFINVYLKENIYCINTIKWWRSIMEIGVWCWNNGYGISKNEPQN